MSEESTTPDLVELTRALLEAANRHDVDAYMGFFAPDAVFDLSDLGIGTFDGAAATRGFLHDWWGTWANHRSKVEEIADLGHGVVFARAWEEGRLVGSDGHVEQRVGRVLLWGQGMIERFTAYSDIDEARAAAERLAESRGRDERGRAIYEAAMRGDINTVLSFFAPDAVWDDSAIGLGTREGLTAIREHIEDWIGSYEEFEWVPEEQLDLGNGVRFVVSIQKGRLVGSTGHVHQRFATVSVWVEGLIERFTTYPDIDEARAAAERLAKERE